jgi:hypothetical protein
VDPGLDHQHGAQPELDLAAGGGGYSFETTDNLVKLLDENVRGAREALAEVSDAGVVVRNHISHLVHHRGQLTVYLRLLDVPLPVIYGPTADEKPW